jgi:phospholipid transport system substrate-binding protein
MHSIPSNRLAMLAIVIGSLYSVPTIADVAMETNPAPANPSQVAPPIDTLDGSHVVAPDALLSAATTVVITRIKHERISVQKNIAAIADVIETTLLPLFDFTRMTQLAVARNWKLASPAQQDALIAEFKTLLVRTYYAALVNYRDEVIEYKPLQLTAEDTDVTVRSTVKKPGVERMTIDYDMQKNVGGWKIYDIRIAGISLTSNYRSSFAEIIRDGGIDELIRFLVIKNRQPRLGFRSDNSEARGIILLYGIAPSLLRGIQ